MNSDFVICKNIHINNMENSAFLIGEINSANNCDSHNKSNIMMAISSNNNIVTNNTNYLFDSDIYDTFIDDRDIKLSFEHSKENNNSTININNFDVNNIVQNSAIFVGKGHITGSDTHTKANLGMGIIRGYQNNFLNNINLNDDRDLIDAIINDSDIKIHNKFD